MAPRPCIRFHYVRFHFILIVSLESVLVKYIQLLFFMPARGGNLGHAVNSDIISFHQIGYSNSIVKSFGYFRHYDTSC